MNGFPSGIQRIYLSCGLTFDLHDCHAESCTALMLEMLSMLAFELLGSYLFETPFKLPKCPIDPLMMLLKRDVAC